MGELQLQLMTLALVGKVLRERGTDVRNLEEEADRLVHVKRLQRKANLPTAA